MGEGQGEGLLHLKFLNHNLSHNCNLLIPKPETRDFLVCLRSLLLKAKTQTKSKTMKTNTKKLSGKVAVVTGASKGIGASIAKHLAAEGASVVVNYASSKAGAEKVVAEITGNGGKAVAVQADVSKKADIERLFAETKKTFGALDILVNNAGVYEFLPLEKVTEEHFHRQFNLNVLGLILTTQEAVKQFKSDGGSAITISSVASPRLGMRKPAGRDHLAHWCGA